MILLHHYNIHSRA